MEALVTGADLPSERFWRNRRVLLTGHTGFKGTWMALWLGSLGARVFGFSNGELSGRSLFGDLGGLGLTLAEDGRGDVRDQEAVRAAFDRAAPEIVLHFAAQALVREAHADPVSTIATNVMGSVHVLEAARKSGAPCLVLIVTSDKCYENRAWPWGYRESDALGGADPYSASKAGAEILTSAYARSFAVSGGFRVLSARAGNVIGGGDWARDRLMPDLVRGLLTGRRIEIRSPGAVRPWQHVLEALSGYLLLCERAFVDDTFAGQAWNFGPDPASERPVRDIADAVCRLWSTPDGWCRADRGDPVREADILRLDSSKARQTLGWFPRWDLPTALEATVAFYRSEFRGADLREFAAKQISAYATAAVDVASGGTDWPAQTPDVGP
ncbi:CDP-glucose 4,6-dehydratase [Methylobacterium nigriterrae]|uniref:CDP-glucose 4,6-dehydratase n=1 Tax=Methylobacterium nigriterrae TaxID=3127512 RepID=UPI0030133FC5